MKTGDYRSIVEDRDNRCWRRINRAAQCFAIDSKRGQRREDFPIPAESNVISCLEREREKEGRDSALWRMNFFGGKRVGTRTEMSRVDPYLVGYG